MKLDKLVITYSWTKSKEISHKISGHLFEACDYILNTKEDLIFLLPEIDQTIIDNCFKVIKDKYLPLYSDIIFSKIRVGRPNYIQAPKVILCDGVPPEALIKSDTIELWLCSDDFWWLNSGKKISKNNTPRYKNLLSKNIEIKYSKFIYTETNIEKLKIFNPILIDNFEKNINPNYYRNFINPQNNTALFYITGNCRNLDQLESKFDKNTIRDDLINAIPTNIKKLIFIGLGKKIDNPIIYSIIENFKNYEIEIFEESQMPIDNLHEKFDTYIYTPTSANWDCSPRLIKECIELGKNIILTDLVKNGLPTNYGLKYALNYKERQ